MKTTPEKMGHFATCSKEKTFSLKIRNTITSGFFFIPSDLELNNMCQVSDCQKLCCKKNVEPLKLWCRERQVTRTTGENCTLP